MTLAAVDVAVLAGGLGTRIRGVLGDTPKVLAPIEGRPYLAWLLDWLAGFGVARVVLCLGHLADRVQAWLAQHPRSGMQIVTSVETAPLGTAGALRQARGHLGSDPVLVMNGDTFVAADLGRLLQRHREAGSGMTVLCVELPDAGRYGLVEIDAQGRIRRFVEKQAGGGSGAVSAGIYLLSAAALDRIAACGAASLERDIFMTAPAGSIVAEIAPGPFIDIGTPESLAQAGAAFRAIAARRARAGVSV